MELVELSALGSRLKIPFNPTPTLRTSEAVRYDWSRLAGTGWPEPSSHRTETYRKTNRYGTTGGQGRVFQFVLNPKLKDSTRPRGGLSQRVCVWSVAASSGCPVEYVPVEQRRKNLCEGGVQTGRFSHFDDSECQSHPWKTRRVHRLLLRLHVDEAPGARWRVMTHIPGEVNMALIHLHCM